ncbi:MAG: MXAN_6640 family putative metalloprotease [Candidatus Eisenbacteria bacterium]|nr:FlgD immunoglobulin-like domain containing protein [Candidatus Eisenbacteria bacterium]
MKSLRVVFCLAAAAALLAPATASAFPEESELSSPTLTSIQQAFESGEISQGEAALYELYAIHHSPLLPARFDQGEGIPVKCGTAIAQEIRENLDSLPEGIRMEAEAMMARPNLDSYIDTAHFRVHYATSGANVIYQWPNTAYRDAVCTSVETCWNFYHTQQGWPAPPSDGGMGGGSGLIDVYVLNLSGVYGVTYSESQVPGGYPYDYTAYFHIDNDYTGFGYTDRTLPMKVTVAHEYNHVVQMGINVNGGNWWMEQTATFCEDEVYDEINDNYNYLSCYFGSPWKGLRTFDGCFEYATFIWPTYMKDNWGSHAMVRDIWLCLGYGNIYDCLDDAFAPHGLNFDSAMADWSRWNIFTGTRNDGQHYAEGGQYNRYVVPDNDVTNYPAVNLHPTVTWMPQGLGTNYNRFRPHVGSADNKIRIEFQALNSCDYGNSIGFVRKLAGQQVWEEWTVPVSAVDGTAVFEMLRFDETEYLFMATPMKRACGSSGKDFVFSAYTSQVPTDVADIPAGRILRLDQNSPNPFNPKTKISFALDHSGPVRLDIVDASGRHIDTILDGTMSAGEHQVYWRGTDESGRSVATGVYFYSLQMEGEKAVRKMLLVE